ncbi:MAG: hypothetical protein QG553_427 [Patescibacteria group bacterium]|nr:hypothetical protein [Patescibacteria group bacterium]
MTNKKTIVFQPPNLPLVVWFIAWLLTRILPYGQLNFAAALISFGALFTWAWLEIFDGANSFRRALGVMVMIFIIVNRL